MPRRVLICIENTALAHVVAARLMKDGDDGVVVENPRLLAGEAEGGMACWCLQRAFSDGTTAASVLDELTFPLAPGVILDDTGLGSTERKEFVDLYSTRTFLQDAASAVEIAEALQACITAVDDDDRAAPEGNGDAVADALHAASGMTDLLGTPVSSAERGASDDQADFDTSTVTRRYPRRAWPPAGHQRSG